jgi:hypothetical protein
MSRHGEPRKHRREPGKRSSTLWASQILALTLILSIPAGGFAGPPARDKEAPTSVVGLSVIGATKTSLSLSWQESSDNVGVSGYRLYLNENKIGKTASTSYTLSSLTCGSSYLVGVSADDRAGNSSATVTVEAKTEACLSSGSAPTLPSTPYHDLVLADQPVGFWALTAAGSSETDITGRGSTGTYKGAAPGRTTLPNGDGAAVFSGAGSYLTIPSSPAYSIPTTGKLTWEMWVRPDTLQFATGSADGYVDLMGKCASYSPSCEWESRMYSSETSQGRCNRLSAYVFNPTAGLGSGANWQPTCGLIKQGQWLHVVGQYQLHSTPVACNGNYPGTIDIWVNGIKWSFAHHAPTGCMSQFSVKPQAASSPVNVGAMAMEYWFQGAIGKVAIYNYLLSPAQITSHYTAMTGLTPSGACAATCTLG